MKVFGNKRHSSHLAKRGFRGWHKGLLVIFASMLLLGGALYDLKNAWYGFAVPPDIHGKEKEETTQAEEQTTEEEEEVFVPPTVLEVQTQVDEQTGEEIIVEVERPASHKEGFYNILVVGTDDDGYRTDTILIARIDTTEHTVALLSIPRDTVISGNYNVPKINSVYGANGKGEKGMNALKTKLAQLLGFEVDGYAVVNLKAFVQLVDMVGGVDYDVPMDMHYEDPTQDLYIHLNKGMQHLDGQKAMQLVRFRKGYATQDLQRTKTQQSFLQVLAQKCLDEVGITDIGELATIFMENVTTDLTLGNIAYFGEELLECDFDNMFSYTLEGEAVMIRDASCYAIYLNKTLDVVNTYFNPYEVPITSANVTIRTPDAVRAEEAARKALEEPEEETTEEGEELSEQTTEELEETEELTEEELTEEVTEELTEELTEEAVEETEQPSQEETEEQTQLPTDEWVEETTQAEDGSPE